jgi:hypothetical protein
MAAIPGTITVNFISNYAGPHRVCWRIGGTGAYDCTTIVNCGGGGAACTATIAVTVDNETCDPVVFDGYVQATCQVEGSLVDRVPFTNTFTPNPSCKGYTLTCESVRVAGATITNPGSGYNPLSPPVVSIATGPGVGATAQAEVGDGGILTQTITTGGAGYVDGTYTSVPAVTLTGTGSGALYTVVVVGGIVTSITLTNPLVTPIEAGSGYNIGDTFEFSNANLGGAGAGVVVTVDTLNTGMITFITMLTNGSGYVAIPSITVPAPGAGVQATFTGVLTGCNTYNAGANCDSTVKPNINLALNESTIVCAPVTPPNPESPTDGLTITQDACCYDCTSYTVTLLEGDQSRVIYTDCTTRNQVKTVLTGPFTATVCMVTGSLLVQYISGAPAVVTTGLACP